MEFKEQADARLKVLITDEEKKTKELEVIRTEIKGLKAYLGISVVKLGRKAKEVANG